MRSCFCLSQTLFSLHFMFIWLRYISRHGLHVNGLVYFICFLTTNSYSRCIISTSLCIDCMNSGLCVCRIYKQRVCTGHKSIIQWSLFHNTSAFLPPISGRNGSNKWHICLHTHTHAYTQTHVCTHIHTCIHICKYIHSHANTHTHTHTHTNKHLLRL